MSSPKPDIKASNCSLTRREIRYSITVLQIERVRLLILTSATFQNVLDIFLLVFLCNRNICTSRFELDGDQLAEAVLNRSECLIDNVSDVVLPESVTSQCKTMVRERLATYKIQVIPRCNSASTLSKSDSVIFLPRTIL